MVRSIFISLFLLLCVTAKAQYKPSVSILGDSYSTYEGYMTPSSNEVWYYCQNPKDKTDVVSVEDTWWWQLIKNNGMRLCVNNSYSGSTVGYTGYDGNDYSARSFITRMNNLGCPDIILVLAATNDSWAGEPMGEYKYENFKWGDFYNYRPALAYMLCEMKHHYPNVDIYFILNDILSDDINKSTEIICNHYDIPIIRLHDIDKMQGHPSKKGMKTIAEQVAVAMKK